MPVEKLATHRARRGLAASRPLGAVLTPRVVMCVIGKEGEIVLGYAVTTDFPEDVAKHFCHDHINATLRDDDNQEAKDMAVHWVVRRYVLSEA